MLVCPVILGSNVQAAGDYPNKPVRIFVPYGPGGAGDLTIRLLADKLSQSLKQQFVVVNRPGAGGIAAMRAVLEAPADGYTLGEMGNGQAVSASLFQKLPYDVLKDFAQISIAARFEMLLAVPPTSPYKSLKELIAAARKAPGQLNLGAINPGSTQNLATSGEERDPLLRDVPTAKESGLPDYVVTSWNGVAAPAGVPPDVIATLSSEIRRAVAAPDLQERSRLLGLEARASTPEEMHDRMAKDIAKWREVIEKAGIPVQ